MAELQDPSFLQGGCTTAQVDRQLMSSLVCSEGISPGVGGELVVSAGGGMSVNVASGNAFIDGTEAGWQGMYHASNDATKNITLTAADPTDDRIDLIVATVRDSAYSGSDDDWLLQRVTGTASPAPVAPTLPDNSLLLATVTVPNGVVAITGGMITDERVEYNLCATPVVDGWQDYTPVLTNVSVGSGDVQARYLYDEERKLVHFAVSLGFGGGSSVTGIVNISLPVPAATFPVASWERVVGNGRIVYDIGATDDYYFASAETGNGTTFVIMTTGGRWAAAVPAGGPDAGDSMSISGTYEAA